MKPATGKSALVQHATWLWFMVLATGAIALALWFALVTAEIPHAPLLSALGFTLSAGLAVVLMRWRHLAARAERTDQDLEASRQFLDAMIDALPHALVVKDEAGRYIIVNKAWCHAVGIEPTKVLGRTAKDVFSAEIATQLEVQDAEAWASTQAVSKIMPRINLNGETGWSLKTKKVVALSNSRRYNVQVTTDVTAHQQALQEVERGRVLLMGVLDSIPNPLLVKNEAHQYLLVNRAAGVLNKNGPMAVGGSDEQIFPPALRDRYAEEDAQALASSEICWFTDYRRDEHGTERWWLKSKRAFAAQEGGRLIVTLMSDITSLKVTERDLLRKQSRLRVLHEVSMAILAEDTLGRLGQVACAALGPCVPDCRVSYANRVDGDCLDVCESSATDSLPSLAGRRLQGGPLPSLLASTLLARMIVESHHTGTQSQWGHALASQLSRALMVLPLVVDRSVRGVLWIETDRALDWQAHELLLAKEVADLLHIACHHVAAEEARRQAEGALRTSEAELRSHRDNLQSMVEARTHELRHAMHLAEQANRAKSQFFASMSHELRTPMHAIISYAKLGLERTASGQAPVALMDQFFSRIDKSAGRLLLLINDVLDLAKLEAARMNYQMAPCDLRRVVADVFEELDALATPRGVRFELDARTARTIVHGDGVRLGQVMRNLLGNALKYSPNDTSVRVLMSDSLLTMERDVEQASVIDAIEVQVCDQGPGIPPAELDLIFDKFTQSSKTVRRAEGTGLGLPIAREIVMQHGGDIHAANGAQGGAILTMRLPLTMPAKASMAEERGSRTHQESSGDPLRI